MSRQHRSPNREHADDPLFELLADEPQIRAAERFKHGLREQLVSFPALAGLITFRVPGMGRVFLPRIAGMIGVATVGTGMALLLALGPSQRAAERVPELSDARSDREASVLEAVDVAVVSPPDGESEREGEDKDIGASTRADAGHAFDPPRPPVVLGALRALADAAEAVDGDGAAPAGGALNSAIAPPPPAPVQALPEPTAQPSQPEPVQPPRDESGRDGPAAPHTPAPSPTPEPTGADVIELPPTATPWPTSEGRPTLPPAFPTDTPPPSKTPEPPTPAP